MTIYGYMLENTSKYLQIDNSCFIKLINESNVSADDVYIDSIDDSERPELQELSKVLKENDMIIVRSLSDLSNNLKGLSNALSYFNRHNITVISVTEYYYTYNSYYQALMDFSRYEVYWREQKRLIGIERATKSKKMGRKKDYKKIESALKMYDAGIKIQTIVDLINISKSTIYRELKCRKSEVKN